MRRRTRISTERVARYATAPAPTSRRAWCTPPVPVVRNGEESPNERRPYAGRRVGGNDPTKELETFVFNTRSNGHTSGGTSIGKNTHPGAFSIISGINRCIHDRSARQLFAIRS